MDVDDKKGKSYKQETYLINNKRTSIHSLGYLSIGVFTDLMRRPHTMNAVWGN